MKKRTTPKGKGPELFWLVWANDCSVPTVKHPSFAEAATEAARLKNKEPNKTFFILKLEAATAVRENAPVAIHVYETGKTLKVKPPVKSIIAGSFKVPLAKIYGTGVTTFTSGGVSNS